MADRNVLLVLDGTPAGDRVVPWARRFLRRSGGAARLLAVCRPGRIVTAGRRTVAYVDQVEATDRAIASAYLDGVAARLRRRGLAVETEVRFGEPVAAILESARSARAGLIALMKDEGRVAVDILRRAPVPVLVVRPRPQRVA